MNGLKLLQRQQQANGTKGACVFINERGQPFVASCAEWSRISVPICAKVEHWCHSPSDPDWCQNSVNVGTAPWLVLSEPRPSADTRENQIGIDFDRFLSPSQQQAFVVVGQFLAAVNFRTLLDRNAPRPRPATLGAQMPCGVQDRVRERQAGFFAANQRRCVCNDWPLVATLPLVLSLIVAGVGKCAPQ